MTASRLSFAVGLLMTTLLVAPAMAVGATGSRRIAVIVGNNVGAADDIELRFAERDATRVAQTLSEIGKVAGSDLFLLLEESAGTVRAAMQEAQRRARASEEPVLLLFYYSGHAGPEGLHLGSSVFAWDELRRELAESPAGLRVALVDACQAGSLTAAKGFALSPQLEQAEPQSRGTAIVVSAGSTEAAQESQSLGGSYFTHFLVSGLRGAADANRDGVVTLAEAHSYTTANTTRATGAWARTVQHPVYEFEITGYGDVVLTDLREATSRLRLAPELSGRVVITEVGSPLAVVELQKSEGNAVDVALSNGRYVVHLRKPDAVYLADVVLPWGGTVTVQSNDMSAQSYQSIAHKGGIVHVYRQRARLGVAMQSGIVRNMNSLVVNRASYALRMGSVELGLRGLFSQKTFPIADSEVTTEIYGGGVFVGYEHPLHTIDLSAWLVGEGHYWLQNVRELGPRRAGVFGLGIGGGVRVPIWSQLFGEASVEMIAYGVDLEVGGLTLRPTVAGGITLGMDF